MKTVLFQGDSVTDAGRDREDITDLGKGYPAFAAARLGLEFPQKYQFFNKGISGNRIIDIYARIKTDIININPDFLSILVGVNDVWHEMTRNNGISADKYERLYGMLIEEIIQALPNIKIMLIEPFVIDDREEMQRELRLRSDAVKRTAEKYDLLFLPLQSELDILQGESKENYWLKDGIHPSVFFHQYIADKWIEKFMSAHV